MIPQESLDTARAFVTAAINGAALAAFPTSDTIEAHRQLEALSPEQVVMAMEVLASYAAMGLAAMASNRGESIHAEWASLLSVERKLRGET